MPSGAAAQASLGTIARDESFTPTRSLSDTSCRTARSHCGWSYRLAARTSQRAVDVVFVDSPPGPACAGVRGGPPPASLREKKMRSAAPEVPSVEGPPLSGGGLFHSLSPTCGVEAPRLFNLRATRHTDGASVVRRLGLSPRVD
jgi:hypothetical protein